MHEMFSRNVLFWGEGVQERLQSSSVLVAGVGGLGCAVAHALVRSGVGRLVLLDHGTVDPPDLNRQMLYAADDIGRMKTEVAAERLRALTRLTKVETVPMRIGGDDVLPALVADMQVNCVADCFDNYAARYALERVVPETCCMVHGGVLRDFGQVTTIRKDVTSTLQQVLGDQSPATGPLPVAPMIVGVVGNLMAAEVVNVLCGAPGLLNTLLIVELQDFSLFKIPLWRRD